MHQTHPNNLGLNVIFLVCKCGKTFGITIFACKNFKNNVHLKLETHFTNIFAQNIQFVVVLVFCVYELSFSSHSLCVSVWKCEDCIWRRDQTDCRKQ